ncbi:MAG: hypothetical protein PHH49_03825 [Candidatus Omnitrophica bacterium]|nr:hypothetical protein [Candidatus Omnitrophota bacterium]MDD5488078.1 hypothetical protein [Candidatus Omnitrophota bacterium]
MKGLVDKVKKLDTGFFVLFVISKVVLGAGLGLLLGAYLIEYGRWTVIMPLGIAVMLLGVILSAIPARKALKQ